MTKKPVILLFCLLAFLTIAAGPALAATANFQVSCNGGIPTNCVLDPTKTPSGQTGTACPGSTISSYFVDWGDGTSYFYTPPPHTTSHTFTGASSNDICIAVFCANGTSATMCHCFSNTIGVGGCVRPGAGWTP